MNTAKIYAVYTQDPKKLIALCETATLAEETAHMHKNAYVEEVITDHKIKPQHPLPRSFEAMGEKG